MKIDPLDKIFKIETTYEAEHNKGFVFATLGTDSTTTAQAIIDAKFLGTFITGIAPKHKVETNLFGPLCLRDAPYVVPPEFSFKFTGESGKTIRCVGKLIILEAGDVFPPELMARFKVQHNKFYEYYTGFKELGTDEVWKTDVELTLFEKKMESHERLTLNHVIGGVGTNIGTPAEGDICYRVYLDDIPLDLLKKEMGQIGFDYYSWPYPPKSTTEFIPFSFEKMPIVVGPDHTIKLTSINLGADITPPTGTKVKMEVHFIGFYEKFVV